MEGTHVEFTDKLADVVWMRYFIDTEGETWTNLFLRSFVWRHFFLQRQKNKYSSSVCVVGGVLIRSPHKNRDQRSV